MSDDLLHTLSLSHILLFPFFIFSISAQSTNSSYPSCPTYNCANITISYPFWRLDSETPSQFCGYEGFGINCSNLAGRDIPSLTLGNDSYYVPSINYQLQSIALMDYDLSSLVPIVDCPRERHNIDWGNLPFSFWGQNVNLSFHFNCSGVPSFATEIQCLSSFTNKSCVNDLDSEPPNFSWAEYSCDQEAVRTVLDIFNSTRTIVMDWRKALKQGFRLRWGIPENCQNCENSGGRCGYNYTTMVDICFCSSGTATFGNCKGSVYEINRGLKLIIGILVGVTSIVLIFIILYCSMRSSPRNFIALLKQQTEDDKSVEAFVIQYGSLSTKRYKYADIKKMTNSFRVKLGQGGFGSVFKGKLSDGRLVAVKVLNSPKASGKEFINEVASIGRTSHVNIVTLFGFCFELKKRALVYEFMPNGSLEKFIYRHVSPSTSEHIGVDKLYEIAIGIARGLDYLHRGCNTRILHLDIKPHNILLDEDFNPKIADFGLAKLYSRKESIVSMLEARGTIGYIAPEVFNRNFGGVSHKSDVYSYGMLILEMIGGRKNVDAGVGSGHTSEIYFPYWIYNRLEKEEFLLDGITTIEENDYAKKMTIVGLWCIQTDSKQRPSINEVIEMLEGSMEALEIPPKPFFSSPTRSPATTFNTSQEVSDVHCISQGTS